MNFEVHEDGPTAVVAIQGEIDALTAPEMIEFLQSQIEKGNTHLVADLSSVNFMSSAGLRAILAVLKESRQRGGDLRLAAPQPPVEKMLKLSGFTSILKCFPDVESAVESYLTPGSAKNADLAPHPGDKERR